MSTNTLLPRSARKTTNDVTTNPSVRVNPFGDDLALKYREDEDENVLWCNFCCIKLQRCISHIQSHKHQKNKALFKMERTNSATVIQALHATSTGGPSVSMAEHVRRFQLARAFVAAGIPLNKLDNQALSSFFQVYAGGSVNRSLLVDYIAAINWYEIQQLKLELDDKMLSVVVDATTFHGEAVVFVVRFVDERGAIHQRLIGTRLLKFALDAQELSHVVMDMLAQFNVSRTSVAAINFDNAQLNYAAYRTLGTFYGSSKGVGCICHYLNIAGSHFDTPILSKVISVFSNMI
jgi:hypothetical protein